MTITDSEQVGRILGLLHAIRPRLRDYGIEAESADLQEILFKTLNEIGELVEDRYKQREAKTYVHELIDTRNKWAHNNPLTQADAVRTLDTEVRLFGILGVDTSAAEKLKSHISEEAQTISNVVDSSRAAQGKEGDKTVAVIMCAKTKKSFSCPAVEMYVDSPLFSRSVETAREERLPIVILSSKYGLIPERQIIDPYEVDLKAMSELQRNELERKLDEQIDRLVSDGISKAVLLASKQYQELVVEKLRKNNVQVVVHQRWNSICRSVYG